jgi:hypothetical protein
MPLVNGELISPDDAMAKGLCPECGDDLRTQNPIAHRRSHWYTRPRDDMDGAEGLRRMKMFDEWIVKNNVRTSDQPKPTPNAAPAA